MGAAPQKAPQKPRKGVQEGDLAPDFKLKDHKGREISLSSFRGKPVVLFFYPKALTSGCTIEVCEFQAAKPQFDKLGAVVLGCSADKVELQAKFADKYAVKYSLLSDPDFDAIEGFNARRMKKFLGKSFLGIVRSSVLIGPDGKIVKIWDNVHAKGHAAEVLEATKNLQS